MREYQFASSGSRKMIQRHKQSRKPGGESGYVYKTQTGDNNDARWWWLVTFEALLASCWIIFVPCPHRDRNRDSWQMDTYTQFHFHLEPGNIFLLACKITMVMSRKFLFTNFVQKRKLGVPVVWI